MIQISNLSKSYAGRRVLLIDDLHFAENEVVGILGNNGAGKTTLFSMILDLVKPDTGSVRSMGSDVSQNENWKSYTGSYLDESFLIGFLQPEEYFLFVGKLHGLSANDTMAFVNEFEDVFNGEILGRKKLIRDLSKGNQKKVGLVGSLIGNPSCIIWDEPFANLDPSTQQRLKQVVQKHSAGRTFLISSHDLHHVYDVCNRIIILHHGVLLHDLHRDTITLDDLIAYFSPESAGKAVFTDKA